MELSQPSNNFKSATKILCVQSYNKDTRTTSTKMLCSKLTIKTQERRRSGVFIVTLNIFTHQLNAYVIRLKVGIYELGVFLQL